MKNDIEIIRNEFRRSEESRYIHRLHGVLLVRLGLTTTKAGELLGDPQRTIAHWVIQFEERGVDGLKEAERSGRPKILTSSQLQAIATVLNKSPSESGIKADAWTNKTLMAFVHKRYGIKLNLRHCSRLLQAHRTRANNSAKT